MLKATIIGNITADAVIKTFNSGEEIITFTVASNRSWKDANGMKHEDADFVNVIKGRGNVDQYLTKGTQVYVEGGLSADAWTDKEGHPRVQMTIRAYEVQLLGSKRQEDPNAQQG